MRRIKVFIIAILLSCAMAIHVQAAERATININIPQEAKIGDFIKLTIKVESPEEKISGIQGKLEYNKDLLEYVGNRALAEGWFVSGFNKDTDIFLGEVTDISDTSKYISGTESVLEFTFKVKEESKPQETNIGLSGIVLSGTANVNKEVMKNIKILSDNTNSNTSNNNTGNNNTNNNTNNNNTGNNNTNNNTSNNNTINDNTIKNEILPNAGTNISKIILLSGILLTSRIISYICFKIKYNFK